MANFEQFFPFIPEGSDWETWNGNLLIFYGQEPIPYHNEDNWRETAFNVAQLASFANYPVPSPETYENWQDWASEFTLIINGPSR